MNKLLLQDERSIEIMEGFRKSKLCPSSDVTTFPSEVYNVETAWEALERSCLLYGKNRLFGWKNSHNVYNWINYRDFKERARHFGCGLVNIGVTPSQDTFVGIYGENSIEWSVAEYGCFSQSLPIIPFSDDHGIEVMLKIIVRTEIQFVICTDDVKVQNILLNSAEIPNIKHIIAACNITEKLKELAVSKGICLHSFKDVEELGKKKTIPLLLPAASSVYMVCFTSGTTGDPKGVVLTHKYFVCGSYCLLISYESEGLFLSETDVAISHLSMNHIFEHMVEMQILLVGGAIGYFSGNRDKLDEDMQVLQPTFFPTVPLFLNKMYDKVHNMHPKEPNVKDTSFKDTESTHLDDFDEEICKEIKRMFGGNVRIILTGCSLTQEKVLSFYKFGLGSQVFEVYGQTECGVATMKCVNKDTIGKGGVPLPSVIIKLVDAPDLGYFARNKEGEICVKGHTLFECYLKNPSKTSEVIDSEGWLHTGDVGKFLPDGSLKIMDRISNIFKVTNGYFIMPEKIQTIYSRSSYVSQVFVYGDSEQDYLVSVVVPERSVLLQYVKEVLKLETTWREACKIPTLKKLVLNDMRKFGQEAGLFDFEQASAVYLHPDPLTPQGGHLTATLKIRRKMCKDIFKSEIDAMFEEIHSLKN